MFDTSTFSRSFALLALLGMAALAVATAGAVARLATGRLPRPLDDVARQLSPAALPLAFTVALICTSGSLYYSEVAGFEPCRLCWYQRIAMYPLVLMLGLAWARGDAAVRRYAGPLAGVGLVVSLYHRVEEQFPEAVASACSAALPCSTRYVDEFGWITIPTMAAVGFALVLVLLSVATLEVRP